MDVSINWIAVVIAAASAFVLGGVWYTVLFGRQWQELVGLSDEQVRQSQGKVFGGSAALQVIMAASLAAFIGAEGLGFGLFAGAAVGLTLVAASFGVNYLFERKPLVLFVINGGYVALTFVAMGAIIGAMQA